MIPSLLRRTGGSTGQENGILSAWSPRPARFVYTERLEGDLLRLPPYADGKIYLWNDRGDTTVVRPVVERLSEWPERDLDEPTQASIAVSGGGSSSDGKTPVLHRKK